VLEWALADLIRDGDLERHLARSRRVYQDRAAAFQDALVRILGPGFRARPPRGGLACWVETPPDLDLEAWAAACRRAGVRFLPGGRFRLGGGPLAAIPLGFGHLEPGEAQEALGRMALNLPGAARG
jgi:GntR family transcriptional regulator/MocR family aminotransferase